jgi:transketolase
MIGVAAGLASCDKIPFAYTIIPFITMRTYEQIRNDVCLHNLNVKIVGVGAGFVYSALGPNSPCIGRYCHNESPSQYDYRFSRRSNGSKKSTFAIAGMDEPVYLRLGTQGESSIYRENYDFSIGKGVELRQGVDATVIATGSIVYDALQAAKELEQGKISTKEEHNINGGVGSSVADAILEGGIADLKFRRIGIKDCFCSFYGSHQELKTHFGLAKRSILKIIKKLCIEKDDEYVSKK